MECPFVSFVPGNAGTRPQKDQELKKDRRMVLRGVPACCLAGQPARRLLQNAADAHAPLARECGRRRNGNVRVVHG
jgi:hypothetical protein